MVAAGNRGKKRPHAKRWQRRRDLTGKVLGRLTVLRPGDPLVMPNGRIIPRWWCRCSCNGNERLYWHSILTGRAARSCGCRQRERSAEATSARNYKHGMRATPEYRSWIAAKDRCTNPNTPSYPDYGGRGIKMCPEWVEGFEAFYDHIAPRPHGTSLDRIDVNGNYEPGNVRWATASEQIRNRPPYTLETCPECHRFVKHNATVCRRCGADLGKQARKPPSQ